MWVKIAALTFTALILIPSGAHLFELPAKIDLARDAYFTVQGVYAGWAAFFLPIVAAIASNSLLFVQRRQDRPAKARWALLSAGLIVASLAVFFAFVFPGNQATENWTMQPENWDSLRHSWEYGHAANAVLVFAAFIATSIASVED